MTWGTTASPAFLDDPALRAVLSALPEARIVGGAVRDALAGLPVADIDLATPRPPEDVIRALTRAKLKAVPTGIEHGTVTAISDHRGFEITTLRRDVETDGRHAIVAFTDDWRADASRRDFTINAMSMSPDGKIFDYFGGIDDLRAGVVRFVGDPETRIAEDHLRLLRYFRFFARYAGQDPDPATLSALRKWVPALARLSPERIWSELKRILAAPDPDRAVALMDRLGVLAAILPDVKLRRVADLPPDPILRLAALGPRDVDRLAERLRLANAERDRLAALIAAPLASNASDDDIRRALSETPRGILTDRIRIHDNAPGLLVRVEAMPVPVFPIGGRDLQDAGVAPGPEMGRLLRELRSFWQDKGCSADRAALLLELARRIGR